MLSTTSSAGEIWIFEFQIQQKFFTKNNHNLEEFGKCRWGEEVSIGNLWKIILNNSTSLDFPFCIGWKRRKIDKGKLISWKSSAQLRRTESFLREIYDFNFGEQKYIQKLKIVFRGVRWDLGGEKCGCNCFRHAIYSTTWRLKILLKFRFIEFHLTLFSALAVTFN